MTHTPRIMTTKEAAEYLGFEMKIDDRGMEQIPSAFYRYCGLVGITQIPYRRGRYDKRQIDDILDGSAGVTVGANDDDWVKKYEIESQGH